MWLPMSLLQQMPMEQPLPLLLLQLQLEPALLPLLQQDLPPLLQQELHPPKQPHQASTPHQALPLKANLLECLP